MHTYTTSRTLLLRSSQLDGESWISLIDLYKPFIRSILIKLNIRKDDIDDLIQDTLIRLFKALTNTSPDDITRFRSLLASLTKRCAIDYLRKRTSDQRKLDVGQLMEENGHMKPLQEPEIDLLIEGVWKLFLTDTAIKNVEAQCSEKAMSVFKMSLKGYDAEIIARQLGLTVSSVYRMKTQVKRCVSEEILSLDGHIA
jgi:RNA polymerase sigma factor (sigma-70 family)